MLVVSLLILASPFAIACAIAGSPRARSFVARHYWACITVGWAAVLLLAPVAVGLRGGDRITALAVICPPMALSFWRRSDDDGGWGPDTPEPSEPDGPAIDWERFQRDFDEFVARVPVR